MLNVHQITRHLKAGHTDNLLRGVAPLGVELPLPLEARISQQPEAVVALALRRIVELTYGAEEARELALAALLRRRNADGSFGDGGEDRGDCLATAAAVDALSRLLADRGTPGTRGTRGPQRQAVQGAKDDALAALARMQDEQGLFISRNDRTDEDRTLSNAFILALLAGNTDFRQAVRFADLLDWFDDRADRLDEASDQLRRLARVDAPAVTYRRAGAVREEAPQLTAA